MVIGVGLILVAPTASAGPGGAGVNVKVSGASPFASCTADNVPGQIGTNFLHSEVEPSVAVSLVDLSGDGFPDKIGAYQQDRWSSGGSRGIVASVFHAGVWVQRVIPGVSKCSGGAFDRASDPWVTISPNGVAYVMTLTVQDFPTYSTSIIYVNKSTDGGLTWGAPTQLVRDDSLFEFNDKSSMTADPFDSNYVYAIWARSRFPSDKRELRSISGLLTDYWFLHSHDGGATWTEARVTPTSFDHKLAPFAGGLFLGDYVGLAPAAGHFIAMFLKTESSDPASAFVSILTP